MRWPLLLATAAALSPPKDDRSLALWLLEPSRTIDEVRAGAETLAARPPTEPCDALALCMASWAASQKQQGDLMGTLATKLAPRRVSASLQGAFDPRDRGDGVMGSTPSTRKRDSLVDVRAD